MMMKTILSHIHTYPIKSLKGISLETAEVQERGLRLDRRWMITHTDGTFITQREYPQLTLIELKLEDDGILLEAMTMPPLKIKLEENIGKRLQVQIWNDICTALEVSEKANTWFSEFLNIPSKLVYMPQDSRRLVEADYNLDEQYITSFSDAYPFLLISESSLNDLNTRLEEPILMNRFRPNLVVLGTETHAEDTWKKIRIGEVIFQVVKPCARCMMLNINQETAIKGVEPLKTLNNYRKAGNKVLFGQCLLPENLGKITVRDELEVLEMK